MSDFSIPSLKGNIGVNLLGLNSDGGEVDLRDYLTRIKSNLNFTQHVSTASINYLKSSHSNLLRLPFSPYFAWQIAATDGASGLTDDDNTQIISDSTVKRV